MLFGQENDRLLCELITELRSRPLLLMGDFNYPEIDWSTSHGQTLASQNFIDSVEESFLIQHVTKSTRKGSILDLVITSEPDMIDTVSVLDNFGNSDHNMLEWTVQLNTLQSACNRPLFDYKKANFSAIRRDLSAVNWADELQGDANDQWQVFRLIVKQLEERYVPLKKEKSRKKAPWMSYKAVKLENKKRKLYKKYKNTKHPAYVKATREAAIELRRAKRNFERKLAKNIDTDKKSFYAYVRSRSRSRPTVGTLVDDQGAQIIRPLDLAEEFNKYFASVFTAENMDDLPDAVGMFTGTEEDKLMHIQVTEEMVLKQFDKIRSDKAAGADDMSPTLLSKLKDELYRPVTQIIKASLETGIVPEDWKTASITPIFKKGSKCQVENYRPVSLTSQVCKLCESIVRDAVVDHLEMNNLLSASQHGFRKGGSCLTNLLQFLDSVTKALDVHVDVIYLDFAKAFDKVPHQRLLNKLKAHGIGGKVWDWVKE